jgi:hypothetical protein
MLERISYTLAKITKGILFMGLVVLAGGMLLGVALLMYEEVGAWGLAGIIVGGLLILNFLIWETYS